MSDERAVVTYFPGPAPDHQRATVESIARAIARLAQAEFGGEYRPGLDGDPRASYFVPSDTLLAGEARALGIRTPDDLFGGVVPVPVAATKAIVHPLVSPGAYRPVGWSELFPDQVRGAVLPGFTAFAARDARQAALGLLAHGPVRVKPGAGIGGRGQTVVTTAAEIDAALESLDAASLVRYGVVVELDLAAATTYSVGQVWVAGLQATYCGTQSMTTDNSGAVAFGGSDIVAVRGDYDALARVTLEPGIRQAVDQARIFDAATTVFAGLFASRRNYDVVRGRDGQRRWRSGVLEQSWRLGGASGAEIAALAALRADPGVRAVRARTVERYGGATPPAGAIVHFQGVDSRLGALTKYTVVESDEPAP